MFIVDAPLGLVSAEPERVVGIAPTRWTVKDDRTDLWICEQIPNDVTQIPRRVIEKCDGTRRPFITEFVVARFHRAADDEDVAGFTERHVG